MYYTGIDLHKKTSFITTIDESGKVVFRRNFPNKEEQILDYFVNLDGPTQWPSSIPLIMTQKECDPKHSEFSFHAS
jgi:hypothetical protein